MSGIGNSTFQTIKPSDHDQNPYLIASDLRAVGLLKDQNIPDGTAKNDYLVWNGMDWVADGEEIHIGSNAGNTNQGTKAVAIGADAGSSTQGANAIAIGNKAGETNQTAGYSFKCVGGS
jgi:hypothetical protein